MDVVAFATWAEAWAALLAALAVLGVGGLIGAWLEADRNRQERMRERMIDSAALFLDATSRSVRELHKAAAALDPALKEQHLLEASAAYDSGYEGIARMGVFFPPEPPTRPGATARGAHTPAVEVMKALGAARLAVANSVPLDQVMGALGQVGTAQGVFSRSVNTVVWSRRITPRRTVLRARRKQDRG